MYSESAVLEMGYAFELLLTRISQVTIGKELKEIGFMLKSRVFLNVFFSAAS